jgi:3D (Asp-Asp-Asp) domain-containing protein
MFRGTHRSRHRARFWIAVWCLASLLLWTAGCITSAMRPPPGARCIVVPMTVTGYCNCGACCSWESTWFGLGSPVISAGPRKGVVKKIGFTSSGTEARHGTIAADVSRYPYGTLMEVPGYGTGRVEDTGGAIKGDHIDLWFDDHDQARQWGRQRKMVKIWLSYNRR